VGDDVRGGTGTGQNGIETFVPGVQPFVEHVSLEQRSREVGEDKSRIRFAREEPPAREREDGFPHPGAARNPPLHQASGRDVLNVQRTGPVQEIFPVGISGTEQE
jgi:hypothetical protein